MQLLRAGDYRRMPWKNGGGETAEIAIFPPGAALDAFDWRVSMARVGSDGPFSRFPGVDRSLCVLEGEGLRLEVEGHRPVELTMHSAPHAFAADLPTSASLIAGPITDLNVMTLRGRWTHRMRRERISGTRSIAVAGRMLVVAVTGGVTATGAPPPLGLAAHDGLIVGADDASVELSADRGAEIIIIELAPAGADE